MKETFKRLGLPEILSTDEAGFCVQDWHLDFRGMVGLAVREEGEKTSMLRILREGLLLLSIYG